VKTAALASKGSAPSVNMRRQYGPDEIDLLVCVFPPTGTIWRIPVRASLGPVVNLSDEFLWVGKDGREPAPMPILGPVIPIDNERLRRGTTFKVQVRDAMPSHKPDGVTDANWDMLRRWVVGKTHSTIGKEYGIDKTSVRDRIWRTAMVVLGRKSPNPCIVLRAEALRRMPAERPENIPARNWDILSKWVAGNGYGTVGKQYGISGPAIRECVLRTFAHLPNSELSQLTA
jgi:hypothetical protein